MQADTRSRWFLIQSKPRQGSRAEAHLNHQGYQTYLPQIATQTLRNGRREYITEPLFPGYLFIRLRPGADNWQPIRSTRGVQRLVSFSNTPTPVADAIVDGIRERLATQADADGDPLFRPGQTLRLQGGGFEDVEAIFERFDGEQRVMVLMNIMNRRQRVRVPLSHVACLA
ncbi:transcription/translation regulatory transformer protein RfaH [Isoalcanivorax indicus]|uniref:transcription/translation regulatory transformer protein RfaH n=1 Tax=Isoalcanivorax indicus TaxID=2202653 RepID=UPI000DB9B0A4|nr:transcription/translation regulatory transformer protein RfaH [Isoalcanivorax indicus]